MPGKTLKQHAAEMKECFFREGLLDDFFVQLESLEDEENPNFVEDAITLFFNESAKTIATVEELLEKDLVDLNTIWRELHKIHGGSGSIGAATIASKAKEVRAYCRQQNLESLKVSFNELKEEIERMRGKLETYFELMKQAAGGN